MIAQGDEGGGHTGEVGSVVLWPQVIDAVAPTPMLAAGGIGYGRQMAAAIMGAQGVWTGSLWLTVEEAEVPPAQQARCSGHQPGHRALAGLDGQALPDAAQRLDRGLGEAREPQAARHAAAVHGDGGRVARRHRYADKAKEVAFNPVGQMVGLMNKVRPVREVIVTTGPAVPRRDGALRAASGMMGGGGGAGGGWGLLEGWVR